MEIDEKNNPSKKSILVKITEVIRTGVSITIEEAKYFINPRNWGHSWARISHEVKQNFNKALDNPTKKYISSIKTTKDSENLGIKGGKGRNIVFEASKVFIGDVPNLSDVQLSKVKELNKGNKHSNIIIDQEKNKVVFEIDVEKIINHIKDDLKNEGKSPEEIKRLAVGKIIEEVDINLKELAKITGGEFKEYADLRLLKDIGERLYQEYDNQYDSQKQQSSECLNYMKQKKSCETIIPSGVVTQKMPKSYETIIPSGVVTQKMPKSYETIIPSGVVTQKMPKSYETIAPSSAVKLNDFEESTLTLPQFFPQNTSKNTTYDKTQSINQLSGFESILQKSDIQGLQDVSKCETVSNDKVVVPSLLNSHAQDNKKNDEKIR